MNNNGQSVSNIFIGDVDIDGDLDVSGDLTASTITISDVKINGDLDVVGNITVSGTVDGRDIATDGATTDTNASELNELDTLRTGLQQSNNVYGGYLSGGSLTSGTDNTLLGAGAGGLLTTGIRNTIIGSNARADASFTTYAICIGYQARNLSDHQCMIGGGRLNTADYLDDIVAGIDNKTDLGNTNLKFKSLWLGKSIECCGKNDSNIQIGFTSGNNISTGTFNTLVGYDTDVLPTNVHCVVIGASTTASQNNNISIGSFAKTSGANSISIGYNAGFAGAGADCTLVGFQAGISLTGINNTFLGREAGKYVSSGDNNTFIGRTCGFGNSGTLLTGNYNTGVGAQCLDALISTATLNTGIGGLSLTAVTTGSSNTGVGYSSGLSLTTGSSNTLVGVSTDCSATLTGSTALGRGATTAGDYSIALGYDATTTASKQMMIGSTTASTTISSIVPGITNTTDLGSATKLFKNLYFDDFGYTDIATYSDSSNHDTTTLYTNKWGIIKVVCNSNTTILPFYPNGGTGVAFEYSLFDPDAGAFSYGAGVSVTFQQAGTNGRNFTITILGGSGAIRVKQNTTTDTYIISIIAF